MWVWVMNGGIKGLNWIYNRFKTENLRECYKVRKPACFQLIVADHLQDWPNWICNLLSPLVEMYG